MFYESEPKIKIMKRCVILFFRVLKNVYFLTVKKMDHQITWGYVLEQRRKFPILLDYTIGTLFTFLLKVII